MKKIAVILLALLLAVACMPLGLAEGDSAETRPYYELEELGVKLYVDAGWEEYARSYGVVVESKTDYDDAGVLKSGIMLLMPAEYDKTADGNVEYDAKGGILGVSVRREDAAITPVDDFAGYESAELGGTDGYVFTLHMNPAPDNGLLDDDGKAMVEAIRAAFAEGAQGIIELKRPATLDELNTLIRDFSTQDLFGAAVDKSVLQNAPYTLIDIWATTCPPCITEMPELAELAAEYEGRVQFLGIVSDATDEDTIELARSIVEKTGADYVSIVPDTALYTSLLSMIRYTPTKLIVDRNGVLVGEPIIGAQGKAAIKAALDALPAEE